MEMKKLLRSGLAILCIVSMVTGIFSGLGPVKKAEAAETTETLPTNFNEVTPRDFGVADFSGNTAEELHTSSLKPLQSVDKMLFRANVVLGSGIMTLLDTNATDAAVTGLKFWANGNTKIRLNCNYAKIYKEDGTYATANSAYIYDMSPTLQAGTTIKTSELSMAITTEVVNFNGGTAANDLKVGIWFDGELYQGAYLYICDFTFAQENISMTADVDSIMSPAVTAKSQWDGYRIVTPATFAIPDGIKVTDGITTSTSAEGAEIIPYDLDKTVLQADVMFMTNQNSYFEYLYNSAGRGQLRIRVASGANYIYIYNYKLTGDANLYIGGKFENGEYVGTTVAKSASTYIYWKDAGLHNMPHTTAGTKYQLWITTEFVDFDGDGKKDDLQIGVWFDGKLLINDSYFYYRDYEETTIQGRVESNNMYTIYSPQMGPNDLGLASGEYGASENTVIGASKVATNKVMNGTTLETDIMFNGAGAGLLYGCNAEDTSKAFKLTSTEEGIKVSHTYNGTEEQIGLLTKDLVGVDLVNNKFHLKLTTDVVNIDGGAEADDVLLGIQVNDKKCGYFVANVAAQLTGRIGVESTGNASVTVGSFASDTIEETYHCLDDSAYTLSSADGISRLSVNGTVVVDDTITLDAPGTYSIVSTKNRLIQKSEVILYNRYDINESQTVDVKDLVRMLKVVDSATQESTLAGLGKAGKMAIAYEGADVWTNDNAVHVLEFMRENLVGAGPEAKKTGEVALIDKAELKQFANKHGAFTGNFTFTLDLTDIERIEEIWILSANAKYISMDGSYPTIRFRLTKANGSHLYTSHSYKLGEKNAYVERQWRVPETLADYTTLEVNFVVPDGVALYIDTIKDLDNVVGDLSTEDETVYSADNGVKYLAHSGFLQYAPDNTLLGFEMAGKMGFKSLITIPKFTKATDTEEMVGICLHDDQISRTGLRYTDGSQITSSDPNYSRVIQDFTYSELAQFDAGIRKGKVFSSPIPTLEQYFDICMEYEMTPVFSTHPELTVEQCQYVYNMLHQDKYMKDGHYWLYERLQIKAGGSRIGIDDPLSVFGFDIGGYIFIQPSSFGTADLEYVFTRTQLEEKAQEAGINVFDKVSVEFFDYSDNGTDTVEDKIAFAKAFGFTRISLAPNGNAEEAGFSSEKQRYYIGLGVNSFTVDYHCSMGLNW